MIRLFVLLLALPAVLHAQQPVAVVSVGPLQLIAHDIMQDRGRIEVLIDRRSSPHHFQLKPSHLRKLKRADLLVWISDDFETGLANIHTDLADETHRLQLARHLPPQDLIGSGHELDGHLWLSADNIKRIGALIARHLSELDAANRAFYLENARRLEERLDHWRAQATGQFRAHRPAYVASHQFLAYLERSLGIQGIGTLRNSHDHGGRLRSLSHLHHRLQRSPVKCLLVDRLPASRQVRQLAEEHQLMIQHVDILGGRDSFASILDLLQDIVDTLGACH